MSDYLAALAETLDREPSDADPCRCVLTDRGTDTLGCDIHDELQEDRR